MVQGLLFIIISLFWVHSSWAQLPFPVINNPWIQEDRALHETDPNIVKSIDTPHAALTLVLPDNAHIVGLEHIQGLTSLNKNQYSLLKSSLEQIRSVVIENNFGAKVQISLEDYFSSRLEIKEKVLNDASSDPLPEKMDSLPMICPRIKKNGSSWLYQADQDILIPKLNTGDKSLMLKSVKLDFDYEDSSIIVAVSPDGKKLEGEIVSGFYSNLHYFMIPYDVKWQKLLTELDPFIKQKRDLEKTNLSILSNAIKMRALLDKLNGEGKSLGPLQILMHAINLNEELLSEEWKIDRSKGFAHGFIPGPYLTANRLSYAVCEWGDTNMHHSNGQSLQYHQFPLWKWGQQNEKVIMIVLEGDDQLNNRRIKQLEQDRMLRPIDYTDDFVGWFVLSKNDFNHEKTLVNAAGDFKMSLVNHE